MQHQAADRPPRQADEHELDQVSGGLLPAVQKVREAVNRTTIASVAASSGQIVHGPASIQS